MLHSSQVFRRLVPALLGLCCAFAVYARVPSRSFAKTTDGVVIYPDASVSGHIRSVKLQVIAPNIIRVQALPVIDSNAAILPPAASLVVMPQPNRVSWEAVEQGNSIAVKTALLTATANLVTGAVTFTDSKGRPVAAEKAVNGRSLQPVVFDGTPLYQVTQVFETTPGEGLYGLGQHQDAVFNYNNQQVSLFQNNTEVAVPLLVSSKHYGILWDNYSVSTVGDTRAYQPLNALELHAANGDRGWLTASYSNNRNQPQQVAFQQAESVINYEFLDDTRLHMPKAFDMAKGQVSWEGTIASGFTGGHRFRVTYAGYLKIWINGKEYANRWRQPWNPGIAVLQVPMEQGKQYKINIEWQPDGGESYLSFKWLPPVPDDARNNFGFSSEAGRSVDYYFIYGQTIDEVIAGYRQLTGKATLLPKWAFGFWQSRERYKTQEEILSTVAEFRKRQIPIDNIVLDWSYWKQDSWGSQEFDAARFSNPDSMISALHRQHTHFMISAWPKFYEGIPAYEQFNKNGWLYKRNVADRQRDWIADGYVSTFYDAFNAGARKGFWNLLNNKLYAKGVDAWWMDASEPDILSNVSPEKRKAQMTPVALGTAAEFLNAYPMENAKGIYEGQRETNPGKRVFILTRSAFAGSQRYAAATWSGDIAARWEDMRAQITAGLNFSISGIPYWTMDIGGFAVEHRYEHPDEKNLEEWREQNARWYQFGAFCPIFRSHGQFPYREIFNIAPEDHPAYKSMLYYDRLRYRLMPYIYSLAGAAYKDNYTLMRPLVMDFTNDTAVRQTGDQYMFGASLLVNPVYTYQARSRDLYLPAQQGWYDFYTGKYYAGGRHITADAPYERMPLFVKEGSIVPFGPAMQHTGEKATDTLTLFVYTGKDARFELYEDEGDNYNYEQGRYATIPIQYNEAAGTLNIGRRSGTFTGMLQQRVLNVVWVGKEKPVATDAATPVNVTLQYNGEPITIKK